MMGEGFIRDYSRASSPFQSLTLNKILKGSPGLKGPQALIICVSCFRIQKLQLGKNTSWKAFSLMDHFPHSLHSILHQFPSITCFKIFQIPSSLHPHFHHLILTLISLDYCNIFLTDLSLLPPLPSHSTRNPHSRQYGSCSCLTQNKI